MAWVPNPGPQTQAFLCEADELFYGGEASGGKTDLGIGLALTAHKRSLLLRRINGSRRGAFEEVRDAVSSARIAKQECPFALITVADRVTGILVAELVP